MLELVTKVQAIYAAFGIGDVPSILATLAEDVDWEQGQDSHGVPWLAPGRGHAHVGRFFRIVGEELEILKFVPKTFCEAPGCVVALVDLEARVRRTGRIIRELDEAHIWSFDAAGRVVALRHRVDTAAHLHAWNEGRAA